MPVATHRIRMAITEDQKMTAELFGKEFPVERLGQHVKVVNVGASHLFEKVLETSCANSLSQSMGNQIRCWDILSSKHYRLK